MKDMAEEERRDERDPIKKCFLAVVICKHSDRLHNNSSHILQVANGSGCKPRRNKLYPCFSWMILNKKNPTDA